MAQWNSKDADDYLRDRERERNKRETKTNLNKTLFGQRLENNKINLSEFNNTINKDKPKPLLKASTFNDFIEQAKHQPIPTPLFGELWFEGEICILYSDTNLGKSILAVQIADSISRGIPINGFNDKITKHKVLYFDFELSEKQQEARYSINYDDHFSFSDNLIRVVIDNSSDLLLDFEEQVIKEIHQKVIDNNAEVLIIDNITYLKTETEKGKFAGTLMKELKKLAGEYSLSILILAHTPKRDETRQIVFNDLAGSRLIANFCDSAFSIGRSKTNSSARYLKQMKARAVEIRYGSDNVIVCAIEKPFNFLGFYFQGTSYETEHLKDAPKDDLDLIERIHSLKKLHPNWGYRPIADELEINHMKVKRILNKHQINES